MTIATRTDPRWQLRPPVGDDDHRLGVGGAPVTLVLFGDYACSYSRTVDVTVRTQVVRQLGDQVDYVFRHFPLMRIHPRAQVAALAAEAAASQGAFWPMHEALFLNQRRLGFAHLQAYAEQIGLDVPRFSADVIDGRFLARIRAHTRSGVGSGVQSSPTVFLNGWRLDPLMDPRWIIDDVRSAVRALEHSRSLVVPV